MPIVVRVASQEDYSKWAGEKKKAMLAAADDPTKTWTLPDLVTRGEKVYAANCVACHQANGSGLAAMKAPALAGNKFVQGGTQRPDRHGAERPARTRRCSPSPSSSPTRRSPR
jgi:cytochrome c oxidase subunit 2